MADQEHGDVATAVEITERAIQALLQRLEERTGARVAGVSLCAVDITTIRDAARVVSQYVEIQLAAAEPTRRWATPPASSSRASGLSPAAVAEYRRRLAEAGLLLEAGA